MILDNHRHSTVLLASAGTGKTFRLAMRFIALVSAGHDPGRILVTTFTRAAAAEIGARILRLAAIASLEEGSHTLALLREHADPSLTPQRCADIARTLARSLHRLRILTIDSFFARCAAGFSLDLDLPPGWRMLEQTEDSALRDEAIDRVVHEQGGEAMVCLLEAITAGKAESRVEATLRGAVDRAHAIWLDAPTDAWWSSPYEPHNLSRPQIEKIIQNLDEYPCPRTKAGKERRHWRNAFDRIRALLSNGPIEDLVTDSLISRFRHPDPIFDSVDVDPMLIDILRPAVQCAEHKVLWRISKQNLSVREFLVHFDHWYRKLKRRAGGVVFDDVPRMLIDSNAISSQSTLAYRIDGAIDHILIDEAQDTSAQQYALLEEVIDEILASGGVDERTVCIVGDVKQSLYAWRNAEPELLGSLDNRWEQLVPETMARSYRSSPIIMRTVNSIFQNLPENHALQDYSDIATRWSGLFQQHETARSQLPGWAALIEASRTDNQAATDAAEDLEDDTLPATDRVALQRIRSIVAHRPDLTIGVLYRTNKRIAPMVHALRSHAIAASEHRGNPLTDTPLVAALLSLLLLTEHPGHSAAAYHIAQTPLGSALQLHDHRDRLAIAQLGARWRARIADRGIAGALTSLLPHIAPHTDQRSLERFSKLIALAQKAEQSGRIRALDFVDLVQDSPFEAGQPAPVRVMTIHASKGLEFDAVILPELDAKWSLRTGEMATLRPSPFQPTQAVSLYVSKDLRELNRDLLAIFHDEEARRIRDALCALYVAITRARFAVEMIVNPSPKNPTSINAARVLRGALLTTPPEAAQSDDDQTDHRLLWSLGDQQWHTHLPDAEITAQANHPVPRTLRFAPTTQQSWARHRIAPSALEGGGSILLDTLLRPRAARALDRGTLFHLWFSHIEWIEDPAPSPSQLIAIAQSSELDATPEDAQAFLSLLQSNQLADSLSRERPHPLRQTEDRLVARREYPFARRTNRDGVDALMTGQIDRLVVGLRSGAPAWADVIDFKTDAITREDQQLLRERIHHYRPQIEAYRSACTEILRLPIDAVRCSLIFTGPDRVVDPFADCEFEDQRAG